MEMEKVTLEFEERPYPEKDFARVTTEDGKVFEHETINVLSAISGAFTKMMQAAGRSGWRP